jgi:subtilisin family serine protease
MSRDGKRFRLEDAPFAGRTGAGVRVAVVDSGIRWPHPHIACPVGGAWIRVDPNDAAIREVDGTFADRIGHGTAVAAAIHEKAPDAELWAIKVFDDRLATSTPVLAYALGVAAKSGARVINLSLGTTDGERAGLLDEAVREAAARGALVVSALEVNGARCFPGAFGGVVAVRLDSECPRDEIHAASDQEGVVFTAAPYPRPIPGVPRERNVSGISFAVANVTGFLARLLERTRAESLADVVVELGLPRA